MHRLVGFALRLQAELLHEACPFEGRAGVGGKRLEEPKIVVVERVELLLTIERQEGAEDTVTAR